MKSIGIIGCGVVGEAVYQHMKEFFDVLVLDPAKYMNDDVWLVDGPIFVCVPTPSLGDGSCDISVVLSCLKNVPDKTVLIKSTVPPGTADMLQGKFPKLRVVSNPEFLDHKTAARDFTNSLRVILGGANTRDAEEMYKIAFRYATIWLTSAKVAEMVKYFTNAFLASKNSFANEMFCICEHMGISYNDVVQIVGSDSRIGSVHLQVPGPDGLRGFGGACLPKDLAALIHLSMESGYEPFLLSLIKALNDTFRKTNP